MKRFIFTFPVLLLASFIVAGCSKSEEQKNLDKANALLDKKWLPHIEKLDSVKDFGDTHETFIGTQENLSKMDSMNYFAKDGKFTKKKRRQFLIMSSKRKSRRLCIRSYIACTQRKTKDLDL